MVRYITPRSMSTSGDLRAAHFRSLVACPAISPLRSFRSTSAICLASPVHHVPCPAFEIGPFHVETSLVCHPGPTVGYRITDENGTVVYLPDHEPALVIKEGQWPEPEWISGYDLAAGADLLIHDAQYTDEEYQHCIGWGHSTYRQLLSSRIGFGAKELIPFHHDPSHNDETLDQLLANAVLQFRPAYRVTAGHEGTTFEVGSKNSSQGI